MWLGRHEDATRPESPRPGSPHTEPPRSGSKGIGSWPLLFVVMAAIAAGIGFSGNAGAIDFPKDLTNVLKKKAAEKAKGNQLLPKQVVPKQLTGNPPTGAKQILANPTGGQKGTPFSGPNSGTGKAALTKGSDGNAVNSKLGNAALSKGPIVNATGNNLTTGKAGPNTALVSKGLPGKGNDANFTNGKQGLSKTALGNNALGKNAIGNNALGKNAIGNNGPGNAVNSRFPNLKAANFQGVNSRIANSTNLVERRRLVAEHRRDLMAWRLVLPRRALPGERGFTGVPPVGETRFVSTEMMFRIGPNVSQQSVDAAARRLGLTPIASEPSGLAGGTIYHFRVAAGRPVADVVRALETENLGVASPNYVYQLFQEQPQAQDEKEKELQDADLAARSDSGANSQYVIGKLQLAEVHKVATGSNVLVAVIDSKIDINHPDLAGAFVEQYDATGRPEQTHTHGTGMVGAIAAHQRLRGIAPAARILAVTAFSTTTRQSPEATTKNILAGMDWAIGKGARVINMSFAGPYDPMLQLAMKNAAAKGVVLVAASGNSGPRSPPLYPAADPNVIAVTATDENDKLFPQAVRGPHVAVAAPGVDVMVPAPDNTYQLTTGTSVAAAHVSGVAALLIERHPSVSAATILEVLTSSAKRLNPKGRDDQTGWGLIDPASAIAELDARMESGTQVANQPNPAPQKATTATAAAKPAAPKPAAPKAASVTR